jgi:hypothetical protein
MKPFLAGLVIAVLAAAGAAYVLSANTEGVATATQTRFVHLTS